MLRSFFIFFIVLSAGTKMNAQSDSTEIESWKLGLNFSFIANSEYFTTSPSISFKKGKHYLSVGPQINLDQTRDYNFYGLEFNYRFTPHDIHKRFNFYFFNLTQVNADKFEGIYNAYYYSTSTIYATEYKNTSQGIGTYFGYGFDFRFWNRIHINQYIGVGVIGRKYRNIQNVPSNPDLNDDYSNHYFEPDIMINLGIGFDF